MDLTGSTFRHPALVEAVGRMRRAADLALTRDRAHFSQVSVVSNVESEFCMGYRRTEANNMGLFLYQQQMGAFARAGAPFDWYLAEDLDAVLERDYRVVALLDCQYLTERQHRQVEELKKGGRTIVSFHAPGYVSETGLSRTRMEGVAGVRMKPGTVRGVLSAVDVATGREWGCGLTRPADGLVDRPRGTRHRPVGERRLADAAHAREKRLRGAPAARACRRVVDVTCDRVVATDADRFAYPMEAFQTGVFLLD